MFKRGVIALCLIVLSWLVSSEPLFHDIEGNRINFSHYRGRFILINYWASWCGSCWAEIAELNRFYQANRDRVVLFGVDFDQHPAQQTASDARKLGIRFPVLAEDPGSYFQIDQISALPTTVLINPNGRVAKVLIGEQTQHSLERVLKDYAG
jgi:thiol-disulfide isomerase/thioredoxin